jgi:hypothetical protein
MARADRGALIVEVGPVLSGARIPPGAGAGASVAGTLGGVSLGVRHALRNDLELTARGEWFKAASFFQDGTTVTTPDGVFSGQAQARVGRQGAAVGARWVHGLVWRMTAGLEVGWMRLSYESLDLVDVSDPGTPRTYGLALGSPSRSAFVMSPAAGVEWSVTDHMSASIALRLDFAPGRADLSSITVPLTVGWAFYDSVVDSQQSDLRLARRSEGSSMVRLDESLSNNGLDRRSPGLVRAAFGHAPAVAWNFL